MTGLRYVPKALLASLDRPFLIWMAPTILYLSAASGILFALVAAWSGHAPVILDGVPNSDLPLLALFILVSLSTGVDLVSAHGFSYEKRWAREVFIAGSAMSRCYLVAATVLQGAQLALVLSAMIPSLIIFILEVGYLFWYPPVRAYYQRR